MKHMEHALLKRSKQQEREAICLHSAFKGNEVPYTDVVASSHHVSEFLFVP